MTDQKLPKWTGGKDPYFDEKWEAMRTMFPNAYKYFCPDVSDYDFLDEEYIETNNAVIFYPLYCEECEDEREGSVVIPIFRDHNLTIRDFYEECDKHWNQHLCEHCFIREWDVKNNTQICPVFYTIDED